MTNNLNKDSILKMLESNFYELGTASVLDLMEVGEVIYVDSDQVIIEEGETSTDVYFLLYGRISVAIANRYGEHIFLSEITQGELFGEMSLLSGEPRAATLTTTRETTLLKIYGKDFQYLIDKHPRILKFINKLLITRLKKANLSNNTTDFQNVCCVQLDNSDHTIATLESLQQQLSQLPLTFLVTKEIAISYNVFLESDTWVDKNYKFANWIHELSNQNNFIIYFCDAQDLVWSELCCRQADRIMLFCTKSLATALTPLEKDIFVDKKIALKIEKNLVVSRSVNEDISGTGKLLPERQIKNIFHVTKSNGIDRLVRYIQGKSIKLVLSGGGAKGFAHLGVYKAMVELGIPIDFVGGTSAGSLMAAALAYGWSYETAKENSYEALVKNNTLNDYHLPFISFLKGNKLKNTLDRHFGDVQIEDLKLPFFAVSSNFSKAKVEILDRGSLAFAVQASMALPVILPPLVKGNSLLVDGGLMDNLPFEHMTSLAAGPNIGVDLSASKKRKLEYDKLPNNFMLIKQKLLGKRRMKVPNIYHIIMGTLTMASTEKVRINQKKFDLYIKPDVARFSFLDWSNFEELIKSGYEAAYPILEKWKAQEIGSIDGSVILNLK